MEEGGDLTHAEQGELDALRRRAYGPDADIFGDLDALARLDALEDRVRVDRFPPPADGMPADVGAGADPAASGGTASSGTAPAPASVVSVSAGRVPRWHGVLVAATAAAAVLLGGAAWSAAQPTAVDAGAAESVSRPAADDAASRAGYRLYIDGLRDAVLSLPGSERVADRMIRDQLRPYGILYGRTVGVGPTADHRFCMIIADLPESSVTCIPVENAYANPVSVLLPAWYSDAESDVFTGLGALVAYTLMPGGSVVAELADTDDVAAHSDASAPTPTAVPPPGWQ